MKDFITLVISYGIMGLAIMYLCKLQLKQINENLDKYFHDKFNGFEAKDIFLEEEIKERLEKVCKKERRQRNDQINLILDEWITSYEKEEKNAAQIHVNRTEPTFEEWKAAREREQGKGGN